MASEVITSFQQICDSSGNPLSGAKINVYDVGTTTPKTVYSDTGLSVSVANPIVTDSAGRHAMRYIATGSYKIVVNTSADVLVYERDNIDGRVPVGSGALAIANGGTGATSAGAALSNLGGYTAAEGAVLAAEVAALSGSLASSEKTHIATGTTAQRPASPVNGDIRRNTTIPQWEGYNGTGWKYFVSEDEVGTSGAKVGLLNANKTDSGNNTYSGTNTFSGATTVSHAGGVAAVNAAKCHAFFTTDGSGVVTLVDAFNADSIAAASVGGLAGFSLDFGTNMASANYTAHVTATLESSRTTTLFCHYVAADKTVGSFAFVVQIVGGAATRNNLAVNIVIYENTAA